jgi:hypothetical protein
MISRRDNAADRICFKKVLIIFLLPARAQMDRAC